LVKQSHYCARVRGNDMGNNYTVTVRTDYVTTDPKKVKEILDKVSKIISNSYIRIQKEGAL